MRADPEKLNSETFDVAIVGGGITGAMVAWEASLRGLSVVLLERGDFASGATGTGTRLIHGGFGQWHPRQVQTVRLALQERQYWLFAAPHLVQPLPVLLFPGNRLKHIVHRAAMALHDRMDSESGLPPGRTASPDEIVKALPFAQRRPGGALLRHEASVAFPARLVIAALQGAVARNARVANHVQVAGIQAGKEGLELRFRDRIANCAGKCRARAVVNASGAWADLLATPEDKDGGLSRIARMYLVTPQLSRGFAVANLPAPHQHFVVPWQGHSLIGAATRILAGDPDDAEVDESQIRDLLKDTNQAFPGLNLERENVLHAQASIQAPASASFAGIEVPEIRSHPSVKIISLAGGHLTMARRTAQEIVDRLSDLPSQSIATALPGGNLEEPSFLARKVHAAHSELSEDLVEHLVCLYGTEVETVLGYHRPDDKVLKTSRPALVAQARYAVEREAACRLADVVFRRMGIGHFGRVSPSALWELAIAMGRLLGWSITQTEREVEAVLAETQRFSGSESAPASD